MITFEQARDVVSRVLPTITPATWGYESDTTVQIVPEQPDDPALQRADELLILVDRATGKITQAPYLDVANQLDDMHVVGVGAPADA